MVPGEIRVEGDGVVLRSFMDSDADAVLRLFSDPLTLHLAIATDEGTG